MKPRFLVILGVTAVVPHSWVAIGAGREKQCGGGLLQGESSPEPARGVCKGRLPAALPSSPRLRRW